MKGHTGIYSYLVALHVATTLARVESFQRLDISDTVSLELVKAIKH